MPARPRPRGVLRPNAVAIRRGLVFAWDGAQADSPPWIATTGTVIGGMTSGAVIGTAGGGVGMVGANGRWGANGAGNTFALPTGEGTIVLRFTADHDSGSAGNRILMGVGNASFPTTPGFACSNFSGVWIVGWMDGTDKRVSVSNSGLYAAGETINAGLSYDATAQVAYMRGGVVVSGAPASYGNTSGADFTIGDHGFFPFPFTQSAAGAVHVALIFAQRWTAAEWAAHEADPWWWAEDLVRVYRGMQLLGPLSAMSVLNLGFIAEAGAAAGLGGASSQVVSITGSAAAAVALAGDSAATPAAVGFTVAAVALAGASATPLVMDASAAATMALAVGSSRLLGLDVVAHASVAAAAASAGTFAATGTMAAAVALGVVSVAELAVLGVMEAVLGPAPGAPAPGPAGVRYSARLDGGWVAQPRGVWVATPGGNWTHRQ
ncbi:hypothetical protein UFOVP326_18 [uncultured Caudovirales phage]|uniref:Uncharacterized protein n=1 Tax=uncultured Caudovirales phage TaxID=2100421 RepID=A0A6J5LW13_9CAUD|nr:hypothetical protein UFOVP326_18 [uncultured Caudovirales phage]